MNRTLVVAGVAGAALVAAIAIGVAKRRAPAADAPLQYPAITATILARVDRDHDGVVSMEEYSTTAMDDEPITLFDRNGDHRLSPKELEDMFLHAKPVDLRGARGRKAVAMRGGKTAPFEGGGPGLLGSPLPHVPPGQNPPAPPLGESLPPLPPTR